MNMKRTFPAIMLLLAAMTQTCASAQNKKEDWAQFYRYGEANAALIQAQHRPRAVFMGDSITDHWGKFDGGFFESNDFACRGISGQTTSEMLVRFRRDVLELHPRVAVIMAGTNDIARNNGAITLENALGNIASMCELARQHGIEPVLCTILPSVQFKWRPEVEPAGIIVRFNDMLREYARQNGIRFADYYSAIADERGGLPDKWANDSTHPNRACYVEVMEPIILDVLGHTAAAKGERKQRREKRRQ